MRVLYDAWDWIYHPQSPAARRLARLVARLTPAVEPVLALPAEPEEPPPWAYRVIPLPNTPGARLRWEQWVLPRLARQVGAQALHLFQGAPWWSKVPVVVDGPEANPAGLRGAQRLRAALSQGALRLGHALHLPPVVAAAPWPEQRPRPVDAPPQPPSKEEGEPCVLAYGPWDQQAWVRLLRGWRWVTQGMGEEACLTLVGLSEAQRHALIHARQAPLAPRISPAPPVPPWMTPSLLHQAKALLQVGLPPYWEEVVGAALALGVPVVGEEQPALAAFLGSAGFLVPPEDHRALGGALIAVLTEEPLRASLRAQGWPRAGAEETQALVAWWMAVYRGAAGGLKR